ncbi:MAG TPA: methyltransferase domain-containing protein [Gaiellaceae bacterium]|jgi:ubiquinone/menaquinone biosynthesis C-methylase UbiE|nr:methyltransferase domain-containing protein [Gaiellaceae bacterium]
MTEAGFDARAARYEELRPVDANWWEVFDALVRLGELRGERVLEVGCGTGRLSEALEQRERARVWAVDASPSMVERAKTLGVNARVARAEALPFKAGWFDAVVMRMMIHLADRPRAFEQAARVLGPNGRLAIASEDPASFETVWFTRYFPSVPGIDRARFPSAEALQAELSAAGLPTLKLERLTQRREQTREKALDVLRSKAFSTFDLIPAEEYSTGLARAEAELPERFEYSFDWLLAVASR